MSEPVLDALDEQLAELAALLAPLDEAASQQASRCEGWTVADVVLHLALTNEMAAASAQGRFDESLAEMTAGLEAVGSVDDGAGAMVAQQRGGAWPDVLSQWQRSCAAMTSALADGDPRRRVQWVVGDMAARTLATTRLAETWIHTGDIAFGLGVVMPPADRLEHVARLAWRTLPYAFGREGRSLSGPVAFKLTGPGGGRWDFTPDEPAVTVIEGDAVELCLVAARRVPPSDTSLCGTGPDAAAVLELVRTWA